MPLRGPAAAPSMSSFVRPQRGPRRPRIPTWHVHGSDLGDLTHAAHDSVLVARPGHPSASAGAGGALHDAPSGDAVATRRRATEPRALPRVRVVARERVVHVASPSDRPQDVAATEASRHARFQANDLMRRNRSEVSA